MHHEEIKRWTRTLLIGGGVLLLLSLYLWFRRLYYDLHVFNKAVGDGAAIVAGLTLLIGPITRRFHSFVWLMAIRRQLGLLAFLFGLLHVFLSLQFNLDRYLKWEGVTPWIPRVFGFFAIIMWTYLAILSNNKSIVRMGAPQWKQIQQWGGWVAFFGVYFHVGFLKYRGWITWFQGLPNTREELVRPGWPPESLIIFVLMTLLILYRIGKKALSKSTHSNVSTVQGSTSSA